MNTYAILDAGRDFTAIGIGRVFSPQCENLFTGSKGEKLSHVAPYLAECDPGGVVAHLVLTGQPSDRGILIESDADFRTLRGHLRRLLVVERERDHKFVYFRFFDPRVLRPFLHACTPDELAIVFGPIRAFHCRNRSGDAAQTFTRDDQGKLSTHREAIVSITASEAG